MPKSTRSIIFSSIVLIATALTAYMLNQLDQIVHGQLYSYGLRFDYAWANPYWSILRIIQILLVVAAATAAIDLGLSIKRDRSSTRANLAPRPQKPQRVSPPIPTVPRAIERQAAPPSPVRTPIPNTSTVRQPTSPAQPTPTRSNPQIVSTPTRQQVSAQPTGPTKCPRCNKAFSQPLQMLDFQGDRPRIVSMCPFCNEIIQTVPKQEDEEGKRFQFNGKDDHTPKHVPSQPAN